MDKLCDPDKISFQDIIINFKINPQLSCRTCSLTQIHIDKASAKLDLTYMTCISCT